MRVITGQIITTREKSREAEALLIEEVLKTQGKGEIKGVVIIKVIK